MNINWFSFTSIILLTLLAGFADSLGFLHATGVWRGNHFAWGPALKSALGFSLSIPAYWLVQRHMRNMGLLSPELQVLGWFAVTLICVALLSGNFWHWPPLEKVVGILVLMAVGWLMLRVG